MHRRPLGIAHMKRPLFRFVGGLLLAVLLFVAPARATDVPLTVRLSFAPGGAQGPEPASADAPAGDAWIFVLDHSGSMDRRDAMVDAELAPAMAGRTMERWKALLLAFKATLEQIEPGSVVQIVKVGGRKGAELTTGTSGVLVRNAKDVDLVFNNVRGWGGPDGGTPLYHGLYLACQEAQRFIKTEGRNACIVVFSDGKDESHSNRIRRQDDLGPFKSLFDEAGFNACLNWISETSSGLPPPPFGPKFVWAQPTKGGNVIPVVCRVRPRPTLVSLKNPVATDGLSRVSLSYAFPLSPQRWDALLAEGFDANVGLRTPDGRDIGGDVVHVAKGSTSADVVFNVPDSFFSGGKGAMFELALSLPPSAKVCRFIQPAPARLSFERQGVVTLSSVKPDSGVVAKVGEAVSFSAAGTEGASFSWTFGDGSSAQGARATHSFSAPAPKGVSFSVTASKQGLAPATQAGTVVVIEAGVKLDPPPTGLKVGDTAVFSCRGQGEVASYDWFVDGAPAVGEDAKDGSSSKLSVPLAKVGDHTVRVRANMRRVSPEETPDVAFSVAPAPFAAIVKPEPNERFDAESVVPLEATVEGGFASGVWTVRDASGAVVGEPIPSTVVASAAKANFPAPESGGDFAVSFVAGEGAAAKEAAPVPFSVKAKDVRLDVVSPVKDAPVRTGSAFELRAATAGLSGSVEFLLVDESSGAETRIAEAKIAADGSAAASHVFPVKDGQGERTLVAKTSDGKVVSDPVPFVLETDAGLVLKAPANNARVEYGGALVFEAEPSGVVQAKDVQWFLRPAGGAEERIKGGTGAKYAHSFAAVPNRKALSYEVYARAPLPDGSSLETDHVIVRVSCPDLSPVILLPVTNGVMRSSFGRREEIDMQVRVRDGLEKFVRSVKWDFGDGMSSASEQPTARHSYENYAQDVRVRATVICGRCGDEYVAERGLTVEAQPPVATFAIAPDRETFDVRGRIMLKDTSAGDVDRCVWTTNGAVFTTCARHGSVELPLPGHPCEMTIGMRAENDLGTVSEAQTRTVRVRYGKWLILAFVGGAGLILWPFVKLLTGNGPAGWKVFAWRGPAPRRDAKGDETERKSWSYNKDSASPIRKWWSLWRKKASIPPEDLGLFLEDMGGLPPKDGNLLIQALENMGDVGGVLNLVPDVGADRWLLGEPGVEYRRWYSAGNIQVREQAEGRSRRCLRVVLDTNPRAHRYMVMLWMLVVVLLAAVVWASFKYAI